MEEVLARGCGGHVTRLRRSRHAVEEVTSRGGGGHEALLPLRDRGRPSHHHVQHGPGEGGVREGGKLVMTQASKLEQGRSREMEKKGMGKNTYKHKEKTNRKILRITQFWNYFDGRMMAIGRRTM